MYEQEKIPIFTPQMLILTNLLFMNKSYTQLKHILEHGLQKNISSYLTNKGHIFDFQSLKDKEIVSQMRKIFDKSDLLSDSQR